eukprot:6585237-Prorocentrum_lima.AAC.1
MVDVAEELLIWMRAELQSPTCRAEDVDLRLHLLDLLLVGVADRGEIKRLTVRISNRFTVTGP